MNWTTMKGQWKEFRGKVQEKWGKLTDDDLDVIAGKKDQLVGRIQQKYCYAKEQAEKEVDEFCTTCDESHAAHNAAQRSKEHCRLTAPSTEGETATGLN